ncbi:MAG: hypothetical protein CME62_15390 [Halobacteriovoraceae bacterium]|nr:hypothetical protein [Halobacteriovoraceae bacterium]|tara:strand:- start:25468 stop:27015 length:1548 start_codon:yes stop_codon:yes gene_type:complete
MAKKLQFTLDFDQDLAKYFKSKYPNYSDYRILSQSLDARGAPRGKKPKYHYILEAITADESFSEYDEKLPQVNWSKNKPIIIGAGPCGLFAAKRFSDYGIPTIVIERGDMAHQRMLHISKYWRRGLLNKESNVCYGEGGAGLFSDGKLITRVKSPFIQYVMQTFVDYGAPEEVAYISNPHLGSNKIRQIISKMTDDLKNQNHQFIYNNGVDEILFDEDKVRGVKLKDGSEILSDTVILATGHSASEMYQHLLDARVAMEAKSFAVGVRIEHPRMEIDKLQYGTFADSGELGAARYRLSYHDETTEKGTYSFCMCPGGYVLSSGTDVDGIVVNGMSNYARNSRWSNSALVVSVTAGKDFNPEHILEGLEFQNKIEKKAFDLSKKQADGRMLPAMTVEEFLNNKLNKNELPKTSSPSGIFKTDISQIFPEFINSHLKVALKEFDKKIPGFASSEAVLIAPETRTSAPITILRDKLSFESPSHKGLYPGGEGAGYAGGITSAAVDGIKIVEAILNKSE